MSTVCVDFSCERLELLVGEEDELPLGELVPLRHVRAIDDLAIVGADVLLLETVAAVAVDEVEMNSAGGVAGGIDLHGDRDETEGDRC